MKKSEKQKTKTWQSRLFGIANVICFPTVIIIAALGSSSFMTKIIGISPVVDSLIYKLQKAIVSHSDISFFVIFILAVVYWIIYFITHNSTHSVASDFADMEEKLNAEIKSSKEKIDITRSIVDEDHTLAMEYVKFSDSNIAEVTRATQSTMSNINKATEKVSATSDLLEAIVLQEYVTNRIVKESKETECSEHSL